MNRSFMTSMANAARANPTLAETMKLFTAGRPVIEEYGTKMASHMEALSAGVPITLEGFEMRVQMLTDLATVRGSQAAMLYDGFADKLLIDVRSAWASLSQGIAAGTIEATEDLLKALERFAAEAGIAFSLEDAVVEMASAVGDLLQKTLMQARLKSLRVAVSSPITAALDSADFSTSVEKVRDVLAPHEGARIPADIVSLMHVFAARLAETLMSDLRGASVQQAVSCGLDLWAKVLNIGGACNAASASMLSLATLVRKLADLTAVAMEFKDKDDEAKKKVAQELGVLVAQASAALKATAIAGQQADNELFAHLKQHAEAQLKVSGGLAKEYTTEIIDSRMAALQRSQASALALCQGYQSRAPGKTWFVSVTGNTQKSWDALQALAEETVFKLDTRGIETELNSMKLMYDSFCAAFDAFEGSHEVAAQVKEESWQAYLDMQILLKCSLTLWATAREVDHKVQRRRVQAEIRALRSLSLHEKDCFPTCLTKRAGAVISCKVKPTVTTT